MTRILVSLLLGVTIAYAADQTILGTQLVVKNPGAPEKRTVVGMAKEPASPNTIVGDPTADGATLTVRADGTHPSEQTFALPQGTNAKGKPFWTGSAASGFKYKDAAGANGAVKQAQLKKSRKGVFTIKFTAKGKLGTVSVLPPDDGTGGCVQLQLTGGDSYSVRFSGGQITNKDGTSFKVKKPSGEGSCIATSTTSTSSPTSTSVTAPTSSSTSTLNTTSSTTSTLNTTSSTTSTSTSTSSSTTTSTSSSTTTSTSGPTTTTIFAGPAFPPVGGDVMFNFTGDALSAGGADLSFFNFTPTTWTALYWGSSSASLPAAGLDGSLHALSFGGISGSNTIVTWQGTSPWTDPSDQSVHVVPIELTITLVTPPTGVVWVDSTSITGLDPGAGTGIGAVVDAAPGGTAQDFTVKFEYKADIPTDDPTGFIPFANVPQTGGGLAQTSFNGGFYSQESGGSSTTSTSSSTTTTTSSGPTTTTIFAGPAFPPVGGDVMFNFTGDALAAGGADLSFFSFSPTTWTALFWGPSSASLPAAGLDGSLHALSFGGISGGNTIVTWQGTSPWTDPSDQSVHVVPIELTITLVTPPTGVVWVDSTSITGLDPGAGTGIGAVVDAAPGGTAQDFTVKFEYKADIPTDDPTGFIPFGTVPQNGGGLAQTSFNGGFYSQQ